MPHYIKKFFRCLLLCHLTPFDWKFLQIGTHRAKDLRKIPSKLQNGELTPVPLTLLVIRVVLLLWSYGLSILSVHNCIYKPTGIFETQRVQNHFSFRFLFGTCSQEILTKCSKTGTSGFWLSMYQIMKLHILSYDVFS